MAFINRQKVKQFLLAGVYATPENYLRGKGVKIGTGCHIRACKLDAKEGYLVEIGNNVRITTGTKILTHYIDTNSSEIQFKTGHVIIEDDVFIGMNTIICNSVTIGRGAIIGAGSIITKDIPPYQVWAGNPAHYIKHRNH